ncbi:hypothetical protein QYE76_026557 [Lolium multiflorum]|uniref:NB-ARC domain-containing protein n=1 Tax=Lolium multiflorum TaxID=4521 RepID=A0AAD8RHS9_LOLMU|nr:hypothetical protein QYE76_026557 [Lolium multiflorum]
MAATATATATVTVALAKLVLDQMERMEQKQNQKQQKQKQAIVTMQQDVIAVKDELEATQAFLKDMKGSSQGQSHMLKSYVRLVRDLAYDGEDCLQEFLLFLEQPPRAKASPKLVLTQEVISAMLKNLRIKVDSTRAKLRYCTDAAALNVQTGSGIGTLPLSRINSVAYGKAPLIGREMERSHLIKLISQQRDQCRVISIWGMLGIGKTALTKSVYESRELGLMFEKGAWVSVMRPFNLEDVRKSLYWQLKVGKFGSLGQPLESSSLKSEELMKPLDDIRCMIVLDGVLSIEEWKLIKPYLLATNARRIIVTTRELSVAEHCSTAYKNIYKLQALDDAAALELFNSKVFMETSVWDLHPDISAEAELILKECDGHPLTIASIGELLSSKPITAIEWNKLNDHLKAGFESTPSLQLIRKALSPTYDDLPYHLQLCVLYLSIFPKGYNIRRRRLITRWIAEGYSCKTHNKSAEEIGEGYFQELINRGIIRPSKTMPSNVERIDYFQVNNLHHKISVSKAMEENHGFVLGSIYNNQDTRRHIVIMSSESDRINLEENDLSHVRSLTVFGVWRSNFISSKLRLLRVLDFEGTSGLQDDDLKYIGDFLHLRYLSVRGCVDICNLPDSVGNLSDLQMLDISGTHIIKLPNTITKLKKLQYIRAGNIPLPPNDHTTSLSKSISEEAQEAVVDTKMPEVIAQTVQFSTAVWDFTVAYCNSLVSSATPGLDMHGVVVPDGIGKLDALHTFSVVNVSAGRAMLTEFEKLTQLQKLGVTGINMENSQHVLSTIGKLTLLISLSIRSEGKPGLHGCLDHTFSPPKHLQSLKLYGYLLTLPTWIKQLKNLAKLRLQSTRLEYDIAMKVLEKLPHLAILRLWMKSFQDEELSFHFQQQTFPSLTVLELADQDGIKSIKIDEGAMPNLELLQIKDCKDLGNCIFTGMSFPPNLKEVVLNGIYEDNFMEHLSTELVLNPNKPNLRWT